MKKSEIIKNFNSIVCEFLEQLSNVISPNYYNSFVILIKINSVEPIKQFINYVHNSEKPLVEYIKTRNDIYFENIDNIKNSINNIDNSQIILSEIIKLHEIYLKLNIESKDNIWCILQALLQLSNEYLISKY